MKNNIKVILAGGGTAGHINPALAIGACIKKHIPDADILYIGAKGGMEEQLVPKAGFKFKSITISGFKRSMSLSAIKNNVITVKRIFTAQSESKKLIKEFKPDLCIGTGGYVSGPVLRMAAKMHIKTIIHEQNAYPGITTKMLCKYVDRVMLAVWDAKNHINNRDDFILTGNPVREEILCADKEKARKKLNLDDRPVILSFGGSLGARRLNEAIAGLIARSGKDKKYQHIHATGKSGYEAFNQMLNDKCDYDYSKCTNLHIKDYIYDMPDCLAAADLVISRAGAISLSEIQAQGKPSILVPSPYVAENHQYHNAMALVKEKAAAIIEEKDLNEEILIKTADEMLYDKATMELYAKNVRNTAITDANERIFNVIKEVLA